MFDKVQSGEMLENIINLIRVVVILIVLAIWTVIGLILWIPLLTRMIAYFSSAVAMESLTKTDIRHAQQRLNFAIEFYIQGFRKIIDVLAKKDSAEIELNNATHNLGWSEYFKRVGIEIIWTIIFWSSAIATFLYL
jgi:hypothetical protein